MKLYRHDLYEKALLKTLEAYKSSKDADTLKKAAFYGVRAVISKMDTETVTGDEVEYDFWLIEMVKGLLSTLTPYQFINLFPIEKSYDGEAYGTKDYFYTKAYVSSLPQNMPIDKGIMNFMWEYVKG